MKTRKEPGGAGQTQAGQAAGSERLRQSWQAGPQSSVCKGNGWLGGVGEVGRCTGFLEVSYSLTGLGIGYKEV